MPAPVCIHCGQPTGPLPRLNRLSDGRVCPACRERLMDSLPALLPSPFAEVSFEEWENDDREEDYPSGA